MMVIESSYACASCGELNSTTVDPSAGSTQCYIEDCTVCCRPNTLRVSVDAEDGAAYIQASFEE